MMHKKFLVFLALNGCGAAPQNDAQSLAPARGASIATASRWGIDIENAPDGSCTTIRFGGRSREESFEACHGWYTAGCDDLVVVVGHGVQRDTGIVFGPRANGRRDLYRLLERALAQRRPGFEWLQLSFQQAKCKQGGLEIPFEGAMIARGATGAAISANGVVIVSGNGSVESVFTFE